MTSQVISRRYGEDRSWRGSCDRDTLNAASASIRPAMKSGFVYIVTNRPNGVLCTGVTSDLVTRVAQHRTGAVPGFVAKYGCSRLVWFEVHDDIAGAIAREKRIKTWLRAWKAHLVLDVNPDWRDLYAEIVGGPTD